MRWDLFCKVIDNHGDLGVCWRLACQLAAAGDVVRLWVDDGAALRWMAPEGHEGVTVIDWADADVVRAAAAAASPDVLIEAFGCEPAPELIARFAASAHNSASKHAWINLEYLSAEPYVERLHTLPSSVFRGPGEGLTKHFFYPGFTPATGGLLREPDLPARQAAFDRGSWLASRGIASAGERLVSLFCYEPAALADLLARWREGTEPVRLLVTAGRATAATQAAMSSLIASQGSADSRDALAVSYLPHLPQQDFDHLLWAGDLNLVRGEDSLVRALWAGAPFVWQIYPQDDDAHHTKLEAFLDWLEAPPSLRHFHRVWNGCATGALPALDAQTLGEWRQTAQAARQRLLAQDDLVTQLRRFVAQKR
ncbi:MAG: elongation factor P maturation arginine rhamnosyltransferase EarP [Variovorax sp.]|nr:MAG: elongation factor P maturation arginine rhamnosyltransferase EarP [Variovorax sp.]